jgi:hypothetical protein
MGLAYENKTNRRQIAAEGGIERVVKAMAAHEGETGVQKAGCWALAELAYEVANQLKIVAEGGIERTVKAMAAHERAASVQKAGCSVLTELCFKSKANQDQIAAEGGIERVVTAMSAHERAAGVQKAGCRALTDLCLENASNYSKVMVQGGVKQVETAMKVHEGVAGVQEVARRALTAFAKMNQKEDPVSPAPLAAPAVLYGCLRLKIVRIFGSSWSDVECNYDGARRHFSCIDRKGNQQQLPDCWVVDLEDRPGKKQHRFDIYCSQRKAPMSFAAGEAEEKQRWVVQLPQKAPAGS